MFMDHIYLIDTAACFLLICRVNPMLDLGLDKQEWGSQQRALKSQQGSQGSTREFLPSSAEVLLTAGDGVSVNVA